MRPESAKNVMGRIRCVPDRHRAFTEGREEASSLHKLPEDLLQEMMDLGLPCRATESGYRFDRTDLENIGLALRLPCPRYVAMRWWARSLGVLAAGGKNEYSLRISAKCPRAGHPGLCAFSASPYVETAVVPGSLATSQAGVMTARVSLPPNTVRLSDAYVQLFDCLVGLTFHIFPESLPVESWMVKETGLADCRMAARLLVREAARRGLPARLAAGFFMAEPFPMHHVWAEFQIADSWVAADPFLLQSLERWGIVAEREWPVHRSLSGLLWRLQLTDSIDTPLALHAGEEINATCTARRRVGAA